MFSLSLAVPFSLGIVAAFNPCGFAMLPVYVSFFLGNESDDDANVARNIIRALKVGAVLTLGFVFVFGTFGILLTTLLENLPILKYIPWVTFILGLLLVPLGIAMLFGYDLKINTPRMEKGGESGELVSMFLFGVSYAVVSLGCTIGLFLPNVIGTFTRDGWFDGVATFLAYAMGMGAVIMTLTVGMAMAKTSIATNMRKILPWIGRISGVLMTLAGAYLAVYGWWEIQVLRGNFTENSLVSFFEGFQTEVQQWINETEPARLGAGLLIIIGAALLRALWSQINQQARYGGLAALGGAWSLLEFVKVWQGERANLFILPTIRTIVDIPERISNWWSTVIDFVPYAFERMIDFFQWAGISIFGGTHVGTTTENPWRWAVLGEMIVLAMICFTIYFKWGKSYFATRADDAEIGSVVGESEPLASASV